MTAGGFVLIGLLVGLYFFPLLIAAGRDHHQTSAIAVLNILLGWTFLGWVAALIWSFTATVEPEPAPPLSPTIAPPKPASHHDEVADLLPGLRTDLVKPATDKTCPDCAETVKAAARVCRFCAYEFFPAAPNADREDAS